MQALVVTSFGVILVLLGGLGPLLSELDLPIDVEVSNADV